MYFILNKQISFSFSVIRSILPLMYTFILYVYIWIYGIYLNWTLKMHWLKLDVFLLFSVLFLVYFVLILVLKYNIKKRPCNIPHKMCDHETSMHTSFIWNGVVHVCFWISDDVWNRKGISMCKMKTKIVNWMKEKEMKKEITTTTT